MRVAGRVENTSTPTQRESMKRKEGNDYELTVSVYCRDDVYTVQDGHGE